MSMVIDLRPKEEQSTKLAQSDRTQAETERLEEMKKCWKAYRGDFAKPLKMKNKKQTDDNVIVNRCAPIVDKGVSFLFGQELKIEASDQEFIDGLWGDDDDRMTLLSLLAMNGGICGQAFIKVIPASGGMKYPRLVVLDPMLVRIVTAWDDYTLTLAYIIEYPWVNDMQTRQVIARVDPDGDLYDSYQMDDTWTITNYVRKGQQGQWVQTGAREEWPYPFAPIFSCQNLPTPGDAWGSADLNCGLIGQNDSLNFVQSNLLRIIKYHAHPKTYARGLTKDQMTIGVDGVIVLQAPDSLLANLEMQSDLSSSLQFAATLRSDMDEYSRVPAVALGRLADMPGGDVSGVAMKLMFQPLLEKTTQKRRLYGRLIRDVSRAALVLSGKIGVDAYEDYPIQLHWQDMLPEDTMAVAQESLVLKQIGVSDQTLLSRLGFDPEEEMEKSSKEDEQKMIQFSQGQGFPPEPQPQEQEQEQRQSPFIGRGQ